MYRLLLEREEKTIAGMKTISDYREEVLREMATNETLYHIDGVYYVAEGIKPQETYEALVRRISEKLNDALQEPYSKAVLKGINTEIIISEWINSFADVITDLYKDWWGIRLPKENIENKLLEGLNTRYKK